MSTAQFPICCSGKLPVDREFIRQGVTTDVVGKLEQWFANGIHETGVALGDGWEAAFDARPPVQFFYMPPEQDEWLAGVIRPSFDAVGRRYPFLIAAVCGQHYFDGEAVLLLPAAVGTFLAHAAQMHAEVMHPHVDLRALLERIGAMRVRMDPVGLQRWSEHYLTAQTGEVFWQRHLGSADDPRKYLVLDRLATELRDHARSGCAVRLPPARDAGDAGFWCVVSWLLACRKAMPRLVLREGPEAEVPHALTLVFGDGPLSPSLFAPLFCGARDAPGAKEILDLAAAGSDTELEKARAEFGSLLDDNRQTPADWLERLSVRNLL